MRGIIQVLDRYAVVDVKDQTIVFFEFCQNNQIDLKNNPFLHEIQKQINEYSAHQRTEFNLPLTFNGTDFQNKVWSALCTIPYGEVRTYKQIAQQIGHPKAYRAVGGACNRNPIGLIVPCHRVLGTNQSLTGYAGGLDLKELLLKHEGYIEQT